MFTPVTNVTNYTRVLEEYLLEFLTREEYEDFCRGRHVDSGVYK